MGTKRPQDQTSKLRDAAEAQLAQTRSDAAPRGSADRLLHELQVHQIELETQNETLREVQIALEEARDRYSALYEFAPVAYLTLTQTGQIAEVNLMGAAMFGNVRSRLLHRHFSNLVAAKDRGRWNRLFLSALQEDNLWNCELSLQRDDGSRFCASLNCRRWEMVNQSLRGHITLTDITERKRAEEELRIAAIAFESQEAMLVTDPKGVIVRVNRAFTRLTGYSAEEVVGNTLALLKSERHDKAFYQSLWAP